MAGNIERGGDDERDDLVAEEAYEEAIQRGVERLQKEFSFSQVAEWFLRSLSIGKVFQVADGEPLDPETGALPTKSSDDVGF